MTRSQFAIILIYFNYILTSSKYHSVVRKYFKKISKWLCRDKTSSKMCTVQSVVRWYNLIKSFIWIPRVILLYSLHFARYGSTLKIPVAHKTRRNQYIPKYYTHLFHGFVYLAQNCCPTDFQRDYLSELNDADIFAAFPTYFEHRNVLEVFITFENNR